MPRRQTAAWATRSSSTRHNATSSTAQAARPPGPHDPCNRSPETSSKPRPRSLAGFFPQATAPPFSKAGWAFRHPTLWEGFASWIATQSHLLTVVLDGLTDDALLRRADCEEENADEKPGTLMRIPPALYPHVAQRLAAIWQPFTGQKWTRKNGSTVATDAFQEHRSRQSAALSFLRHRSGDAFLRTCLDADPDLPDHQIAR